MTKNLLCWSLLRILCFIVKVKLFSQFRFCSKTVESTASMGSIQHNMRCFSQSFAVRYHGKSQGVTIPGKLHIHSSPSCKNISLTWTWNTSIDKVVHVLWAKTGRANLNFICISKVNIWYTHPTLQGSVRPSAGHITAVRDLAEGLKQKTFLGKTICCRVLSCGSCHQCLLLASPATGACNGWPSTWRLLTDHKMPILPAFYHVLPVVLPGWQADIAQRRLQNLKFRATSLSGPSDDTYLKDDIFPPTKMHFFPTIDFLPTFSQ